MERNDPAQPSLLPDSGALPQAYGATLYVPADHSLPGLAKAVQRCQGWELYANATQAVFGEGPREAIMLVGEQPGDQEDRQGRPFVGPAGAIRTAPFKLSACREIRSTSPTPSSTSVVAQGKVPHSRNTAGSEVRACLPWLEAEIDAVQPSLIVCLGSTAVLSLLGLGTRVLANRGLVWYGNSCLASAR